MTTKLANFQAQPHNDRFFGLMVYRPSFLKQFIGFMSESDYSALTYRFCRSHGDFEARMLSFRPNLSRSHEGYFQEIVGISWYHWAFVVFFLFLNVHGWHAYFCIVIIPVFPLIIMGTILEHIVTKVALEICEKYAVAIGDMDLILDLTDNHFWLGRPRLVLHLIHFIVFQNAFQIAIFLWIWITFGFDSCMMGQLYYTVPRLFIGVCSLGLCGYSTLPLYTIITEMGTAFDQGILNAIMQRPHQE